ncbi:hypothetical protein BHM03_00055633 [Ensete ventricosum]|nr:hypothetical protein BHM03_00055633 [Ensete ventricosum]
MYKPPALSTLNHPLQLKKLTRKELRDRSAKDLCWNCDEPWSRDHCCKRGFLLLIEPLDDLEEEVHEHEEERSNPKLIIRKGSNIGVAAYGSGVATLAADDGTQRYCLCEGGGSDD